MMMMMYQLYVYIDVIINVQNSNKILLYYKGNFKEKTL